MRNQFSGSYFPDSNFTFFTSRNNELSVMTQSYSSNTSFMSIINLPKLLVIINSICSNFTIWPTWKNDFISEKRTFWINTRYCCLLIHTSGFHWIIISIPKSDSTIIRTCDKSFRASIHVIDMTYCFCVIFG